MGEAAAQIALEANMPPRHGGAPPKRTPEETLALAAEINGALPDVVAKMIRRDGDVPNQKERYAELAKMKWGASLGFSEQLTRHQISHVLRDARKLKQPFRRADLSATSNN